MTSSALPRWSNCNSRLQKFLVSMLNVAEGRVRPGRLGVAAPADSGSTGRPSMAGLLCEPHPRRRPAARESPTPSTWLKSSEASALAETPRQSRVLGNIASRITKCAMHPQSASRLFLSSRAEFPSDAEGRRGAGSDRRLAMDGQPVDSESAWSGYAGATRADPTLGDVQQRNAKRQLATTTRDDRGRCADRRRAVR